MLIPGLSSAGVAHVLHMRSWHICFQTESVLCMFQIGYTPDWIGISCVVSRQWHDATLPQTSMDGQTKLSWLAGEWGFSFRSCAIHDDLMQADPILDTLFCRRNIYIYNQCRPNTARRTALEEDCGIAEMMSPAWTNEKIRIFSVSVMGTRGYTRASGKTLRRKNWQVGWVPNIRGYIGGFIAAHDIPVLWYQLSHFEILGVPYSDEVYPHVVGSIHQVLQVTDWDAHMVRSTSSW